MKKRVLLLTVLLIVVLSSSLTAFAGSHVHSYSRSEQEVWGSETHKFVWWDPLTSWPITMSCTEDVSRMYTLSVCDECGYNYSQYKYTIRWGNHSNSLCNR